MYIRFRASPKRNQLYRYREYCVLVRARMKVTLVSIDILLSVNTSHLFATTIHVQYSKAYTSDSPSEHTA